MPIIFRGADKGRRIELIEIVLREFLFHGLQSDAIAAVREHLDWMRQTPKEMTVQAGIVTHPESQATEITLKVWFSDPIPNALIDRRKQS